MIGIGRITKLGSEGRAESPRIQHGRWRRWWGVLFGWLGLGLWLWLWLGLRFGLRGRQDQIGFRWCLVCLICLVRLVLSTISDWCLVRLVCSTSSVWRLVRPISGVFLVLRKLVVVALAAAHTVELVQLGLHARLVLYTDNLQIAK